MGLVTGGAGVDMVVVVVVVVIEVAMVQMNP
jgi:hypothetical protein